MAENPSVYMPQGQRAATLSLALASKLVGEQLPHCRKLGRYAFFAFLAVGAGILTHGLLKFADMPEVIYRHGGSVALLASFLVLRDMSKAWDLAVYAAKETEAHADALAARQRGEAE